jgi:tetratricopeptide (TPR) repeat protein
VIQSMLVDCKPAHCKSANRKGPGMYARLALFPMLFLTVAFQAPEDALQRHYKAAQHLQSAGKPKEALAEYSAALGEAYAHIGKILLAGEEYTKACKAFEQAAANGNASEALRINQATAYFYTQQYERALAPLQQVLAGNSRSHAAHHLLGKVYFMLRQFDKAVAELEMALKFKAADFDTSYTLALAHLKQKRLAMAQRIFAGLLGRLGNRPEVHILFGRAYRETEYLDEAILEFRKTIALNPKHPGARYCLGLSYLLKDGTLKLKEAAAEFRGELANYPEDYLAIYNLGLICVIERQYEEGARLLEKSIGLRPQNPDAHLFLGNAYHGLRQFEKAIEAFKKCMALNPNLDKTSAQAAEAHFLLGKSLVAVGRLEEGEKELQAAGELKAKSLSSDRQRLDAYMKAEEYRSGQIKEGEQGVVAFAHNPAEPKRAEKLKESEAFYRSVVATIHHRLGLMNADLENFAAAVEQFQMALEWDSKLRDIQYNLGLACYRAERYRDAIEPLESELKINRGNLSARHLLGMCYFMTDNFTRASELLGEVLSAKPDNIGLSYTLSLALIKQSRVQEANEVIQRMLKFGGDSPQVHILLSQAYYAQNDDAKALEELKKAVEMDGRVLMAHYYRGLIQVKAGRFEEAARAFEAELAINPKDLQAKYHLGFVLLANGDSQRGVKLMREVIAFRPDFADARFELGKALLQQGDSKAAIESLEIAVKLEPLKPHIHYQLGRAYTTVGREAEAQKCFETFKQLKEKERLRTNP